MMKAVSGVFKTQMFSSTRTTLTDAYRFCQDGCSQDSCCEGYVLNQIIVNGGALAQKVLISLQMTKRDLLICPPSRFSFVWLAEFSISPDVWEG